MHGVLDGIVNKVSNLVGWSVCLDIEKNLTVSILKSGHCLGPEGKAFLDHFFCVFFHLN